MQTINELLNFTFSPDSMKQSAINAFSPYLIKLNEQRIRKLNKIVEDIGESSFKFTGENLIPNVFRKFKRIVQSGDSSLDAFERRELRTLTYALSYSENGISFIYSNPKELDLVFAILKKHWRDSYLIGLFDCYLRNWESNFKFSTEKLGSFIFERLKLYEGGRTLLKSFQANIKFFDHTKGNLELGYTLALINKSINEAAKHLSLPDSWFSYTYFSKVILAYYEKRQKEIDHFIDDLSNALMKHNKSITSKRVISKLIIQADSSGSIDLQDKVKDIAFKLIGDPSIASRWIPFEHATESERFEIELSREILNEWITKQFINVFFEKCINDPRRKKFWLNLSKHITAFKIYGSLNILYELKQDKRVTEFVDSRFDKSNGGIAAFFHVKNYKFIEFSDSGSAFYAYKQSNPKSPSMDKKYHNVYLLKDTSLPKLVRRNGYILYNYSDEGSLGHRDGAMSWEDVFSAWIKNKVGINV